ncbi:MAG: hypothetical protein AB7O74_01515 [Candidatus Nanopelagicales bacterium]
MRADILLGLLLLLALNGLLMLWLWFRPARPLDADHGDLRRADDGLVQDQGRGLGSASYWPTA